MKEEKYPGQKEFEKYCQETETPLLFWIVLAMMIIGGAVYTMGYLNAGL